MTSETSTGCTTAYPHALTPVPLNPAYNLYVRDMVVCTNTAQSQVLLRNRGEVAWFPASQAPNSYTRPQASNLAITNFKEIMKSGGVWQGMVLPGDVVAVDGTPSQVSWTMSPELTATWIGYERGIDEAKDLGASAFMAAVDRRTKVGAAVATCTLATYEGYRSYRKGEFRGEPLDVVEAGWGVAGGGSACATSWYRLRQDRTTGIPAGDLKLKIDRSLKVDSWIERNGKLLKNVNALAKSVQVLAPR